MQSLTLNNKTTMQYNITYNKYKKENNLKEKIAFLQRKHPTDRNSYCVPLPLYDNPLVSSERIFKPCCCSQKDNKQKKKDVNCFFWVYVLLLERRGIQAYITIGNITNYATTRFEDSFTRYQRIIV